MATTYTSGLTGNVRVGSTAVGGIFSWSLSKNLNVIATPSFNLSSGGAGNVVFNIYPLKGLADANASIEGYYDIGDNSETKLYLGQVVALDLWLVTSVPFGYTGLAGVVKSISVSTSASNNAAASFRAEIQLSGTVAEAS